MNSIYDTIKDKGSMQISKSSSQFTSPLMAMKLDAWVTNSLQNEPLHKTSQEIHSNWTKRRAKSLTQSGAREKRLNCSSNYPNANQYTRSSIELYITI